MCQICSYVYDESVEKVKFDALPPDWTCPLCGAPKNMFNKLEETTNHPEENVIPVKEAPKQVEEMRELSDGELAAVFSNLSRGCEKQYKEKEAKLYAELAAYYTKKTEIPVNNHFAELLEKVNNDLSNDFVQAKNKAQGTLDRGAMRALTWSEKVSRITTSILARYEKDGNAMLLNTKLWVCDICGFIYIGDVPPSVCPVCKVPNFKIMEVPRT